MIFRLPTVRVRSCLTCCAASLFLGLSLTLSTLAQSPSLYREGAPTLNVASGTTVIPATNTLAPLVREISPAVVNISVESSTGADVVGGKGEESIPQNPFFRKEPSPPLRSLGSGFILSEEGYIATNNHVIDKSKKIIVRLLNDKTEYSAKLIGSDPKTDLALIKIEPKTKLTVAYLGDSDSLEVGDWVVAIGNQFQLGQTVTAGIVSATSRRVPTGSPYDAFIQTDASINPGSSGGPLFNLKGQVVGINTAIFSPGRIPTGGAGFNIGIGFAIPVSLAKGILMQLKEQGKVTRGLLGVMIQKIDQDLSLAIGLPSPNGALVSDIIPETPASKAGFARGDVIVSFNGHPVNDHDELPLMVANTTVGSSATIGVLRGGKKIELIAVINELKDSKKQGKDPKPSPDRLGLSVAPLTGDQANLSPSATAEEGIVITDVEAGSSAEEIGLLKGDIILQVGGVSVGSVDRYAQIVKGAKSDAPLLLLIKKSEGTRYFTIRPK